MSSCPRLPVTFLRAALWWGFGVGAACASASQPAERALVLEHADALLQRGDPAGLVNYMVDPSLGHAEAFRLERVGDNTRVVAGGPGGVLYGVQEALTPHSVVGAEGAPDFDLRGAVVLMLSASWAYQSDLSPEVYPWFFDRAFMTRYLDYLLSARLNTLVLWSGHLFPHILELPGYPDASQFSREEIRRNQEQFRWLATECARRNITILTHFYNIHISEHQAKALGRTGEDPTRYTEPDDFVRGYYQTILSRYFEEFPSVGLYICPGESLALEHQKTWFRDVIFKAAGDSGKNPKLIIRDWTLADDFREALPTLYGNLYSERKHNDETITSPWPDVHHREWKGVLSGHIINLHDPADATPYRTGSPRLFNEMVGRWKDEGYFKGAWFYPPGAWSWPWTSDIVSTSPETVAAVVPDGHSPQGGGRDDRRYLNGGQTLLTTERDELWHLLEGRYLWKAGRDPQAEEAWAAEWLGRKFGNPQVGENLAAWYDLTGPILPGLQNLTAIRFGNFFPVSVAWVQATVDDILSYRTRVDGPPLQGVTGLTRQRYYSQPVDAYTTELYRARYDTPELKDLRSMPVAQYAEELATGGTPEGYLLPDRLLDLYLEMGRQALAKAEEAAALPSTDPAELQRFVQDSRCLVYTVEYYRHKVLAALAKRLVERTRTPEQAAALREHMAASVKSYEQMFTYARQFYRGGTAMFHAETWEATFEKKVKWDYDLQMAWLKVFEHRIP